MPVIETAAVTSADGTRVCYRTVGDGPPLVVVHGAVSTSDDYVPLALRLAPDHRVALIDRRGYRGSGLGPGPASFTQDGEDLVALLRTLGPPAALFGHSGGALAALHAARLAPELVSVLVLYEPPLTFGGTRRQPLLDRYRQLCEVGDEGDALVAFMSSTSAVPEDVARLWVAAPEMSPRVSGVATAVGRDLEATVALEPTFAPWSGLAVPVTLLLGSESRADPLADSVRGLAAVLPRSRVVIIPGQEHLAHVLAPEVLAEFVRAAIDGRS